MSGLPRGYAAAARAHDNACDCCHEHAENERPQHPMAKAWGLRARIRATLGRPTGLTVEYRRADTGVMEREYESLADPILRLASLRRVHRQSRGGYWSMKYGEVRQLAVSPVFLPRDRVEYDRRAAA